MNIDNNLKLCVVGSGTAGLISALMLKEAYPLSRVDVVSSSSIGIIGVGEGSTEHWRMFMDICQIPLLDLIVSARATHKNGIRFKNWTEHTPDYFHSVSRADTHGNFGIYGIYNGLIEKVQGITENTASRAMIEDMVRADKPHESVNQYHFDTFALNNFLVNTAKNRGIFFHDKEVCDVLLKNTNGNIESLIFNDGTTIEADMWIDASGLSRILISKLKNDNWRSFKKYLQLDRAIAFPTDPDPSGKIKPYTIATALKNGWVWEIPTQDRRGNGYVYSSQHCSDDQAVAEVSALLGFEVEPARLISFEAGHLKEMWIKNCVAVGLASSFVEPIEATSIGSTIQQLRCLIPNLSSYQEGSSFIQKNYNIKMNNMMDNILAMVRLHYISDRRDSQMWIDQSHMDIPDYLQNLLDLWSERPPFVEDISTSNFEMFLVPHFYHVGQGQKIFKEYNSTLMIDRFNIRRQMEEAVSYARLAQTDHAKVDHAESLRQISL